MPKLGTKIAAYWDKDAYTKIASFLASNHLPVTPDNVSTAALETLHQAVPTEHINTSRMDRIQATLQNLDAAAATKQIITEAASQMKTPPSALDLVVKALLKEQLQASSDGLMMAIRQMLDAQTARVQDLLDQKFRTIETLQRQLITELGGVPKAPEEAPVELTPLPIPERVLKKAEEELKLMAIPSILVYGISTLHHEDFTVMMRDNGLSRCAKVEIASSRNYDLSKIRDKSFDHVLYSEHEISKGDARHLQRVCKRPEELKRIIGGVHAIQQALATLLFKFKAAQIKAAQSAFQ